MSLRLSLGQINTNKLASALAQRSTTHNLAGLPELHNVDNLLSGHDWQGQCANHLRPGNTSQGVEDRDDSAGQDAGSRLEVENVREVLHDDRVVNRCSLVVVEVGANEEDFVEEAEREQDVLLLVIFWNSGQCRTYFVVIVEPENA